ncbi:carboxypeptidase-like regulatory domain-containing protein [Longispora urticae]
MRRRAGRMLPGVVVLGAVFLAADPAAAADEIQTTVNPAAVTLRVGGSPVTVGITLTNTSAVPGNAGFTVTMPAELVAQGAQFNGATPTCQTAPTTITCPSVPVPAAANTAITVSIAPPAQSALTAGQSVAGTATVSGAFTTTAAGAIAATFTATLTGPVPTGVPSITGRVLDTEAKPVAGAVVTITDPTGKSRGVTSGETGAFTYTAATPADQFAPGVLTLVATKSGYTPTTVTRTGTVGIPLTDVDVPVTAEAAKSAVQRMETATGPEDGMSPMTTFLLIVGVLLLLGGGAAAFFLLRRDRDTDEGPARPTPRVYRSGAEPVPTSGPPAPAEDHTATQLLQAVQPRQEPAGQPRQTAARDRPGREPKPWDWLDD